MSRLATRAMLGALLAVLASGSTTTGFAANNAPLGYQILCLQTPSECQGGGAAVLEATPNSFATLKRVNAMVNKSIKPRSDGNTDVWTVGAKAGDCEDYALTKRHELIRAGLPASALRLAYVKTSWGEGHAILVVKTTRGDYVLDNLTHAIRPLSQSGYRIISMAQANPRVWS